MKLTEDILLQHGACDPAMRVFRSILALTGRTEIDILSLPPGAWLQLGFAPYWGWLIREFPGESCWSLANADLREAGLAGVDLRGANLAGADLTGADIRRADFQGASI